MELNKHAKELLENGRLEVEEDVFVIKEFNHELNEEKKYVYECLLSKEGKKVVYGHVKKTSTKLGAVKEALEHLAMMGYEFT